MCVNLAAFVVFLTKIGFTKEKGHEGPTLNIGFPSGAGELKGGAEIFVDLGVEPQ